MAEVMALVSGGFEGMFSASRWIQFSAPARLQLVRGVSTFRQKQQLNIYFPFILLQDGWILFPDNKPFQSIVDLWQSTTSRLAKKNALFNDESVAKVTKSAFAVEYKSFFFATGLAFIRSHPVNTRFFWYVPPAPQH
jgi:hypothetical protein